MRSGAGGRSPELAVVVLNYRTPHYVRDCLDSLATERGDADFSVLVVDNDSGDGSADAIDEYVRSRAWGDWVTVVRSPRNGGFAAGNNVGLDAIEAAAYLLLNSDTVVRPGALARLLEEHRSHPEAGLIGPTLEWPDGSPQNSAFNQPTPFTEFLRAAATGFLDDRFQRHVTAMPLAVVPDEVDWVSFAAVLVPREVVRRVGPMDDGYFMYFEDIDYARRVRRAGWRVRYCRAARIVHLRGGSSPVKAMTAARKRLPPYWYASRARYFAKFYGRAGLLAANLLWLAGRAVSKAREILERRESHLPERQAADVWSFWRDPLAPFGRSGG